MIGILLLATVSHAGAGLYYVNGGTGNDLWDGSSPLFQSGTIGPKATLQAAMDAAGDQDAIRVADGSYSGAGNRDLYSRGKALTLQSENGPDACLILPAGSPAEPHRGFYLDSDCILEGFTIRSGYAWGGGIYCVNSSPILRNCVLQGNSSQGKGGGLACDHASLLLEGCVIRQNTANDGGGIYGYQSQITIRNCTIRDNRTPDSYVGGGLCCESASHLQIENSIIHGNVSGNQGGGIYCDSSSIQLINSTVIGNTAESLGGGVYAAGSNLSLLNCTFSANVAVWYGGGIRCWNATEMTLTNCIFWNNQIQAAGGQGAEIAIGTGSIVTISYSDIEIPSQTGVPAGIYAETDCTLNWDTPTNRNADPRFVREGSWDPNGTAEDPADDFWTDGDYRLVAGSPCVDQGTNAGLAAYPTDLAGAKRIQNEVVDLGAYENGDLQCLKFAVKAGKILPDRTRVTPADSFTATGRMEVPEQYLNHAEIVVRLMLQDRIWEDTIATDSTLFQKNAKKPIYSFKRKLEKNALGGISYLKLDLVKKTFALTAGQLDLTGLQAPLPVEVQIGDQYQSSIILGEDILNQKKYVPLQFLFGYRDALRVEKYRFKAGKKADIPSDSLVVTGSLAVADPLADLAGQEVIVRWGSFEAVIPSGSEGLILKGTKYKYKRPKTLVNSSVSYVDQAVLDPVKCTFQIVVKNAAIGVQPEPVTFGLRFGAFQQTDTLP